MGYWQFEGDGKDSSGNGRDLTLQGGIRFAPGLSGLALDCTGDPAKYAERTVDDQVFDFGSGDFTIQAWVNHDTTSGEQPIIEKFHGTRGPGWTLTRLPDDQLQFFALDYAVINTEPLIFSPQTWCQVVVRRRGPDIAIFVNHQLFAYVSYPEMYMDPNGSISDATDGLLVGRRNLADGRAFVMNGRIDEMAIWNRALSDAELSTLWMMRSLQLDGTMAKN